MADKQKENFNSILDGLGHKRVDLCDDLNAILLSWEEWLGLLNEDAQDGGRLEDSLVAQFHTPNTLGCLTSVTQRQNKVSIKR